MKFIQRKDIIKKLHKTVDQISKRKRMLVAKEDYSGAASLQSASLACTELLYFVQRQQIHEYEEKDMISRRTKELEFFLCTIVNQAQTKPTYKDENGDEFHKVSTDVFKDAIKLLENRND